MRKDEKMKTRNEIPEQYKWRLEDIYQTEEQWEAEYRQLEEALPRLEALKQGIASSAQALEKGLQEIYSASLLLERLYVYARMRRDEDNANSYYQGLADRAQSIEVKFSSATSFLNPLLLSLPEGVLEEYARQENLAQYRFMLEDLLRSRAHVLKEGEERLLSMAGDFSGGAQGIFTMLNNADLSFGSVEHEGKAYPLTHASYIQLMQSEDRELRKKVFYQFYQSFQSHINTIAATYGTSVKKDVFYARARGYESSLAAALFSDNVPKSVYSELIQKVHEHLPTMYRYVALRQRILGVEQLEMYDIYAPLVRQAEVKYSYEQAQQLVLEGLSVLGEEYISHLKEAFCSGWIDVFENQGKTSGAYSWGAYGTHPYVLLNHREDLDSAFTIAHELGHAMHSYYSDAAQPYPTAGYAIFVAEVASTVNEILLTKHLLRTVQDEKLKKYILNHYIDQFRTTVLRQTMFAEFEMKAHEMAEAGAPLTVESMCKVYGELNALYHGPKMGADPTISYEWARIPHFYNAFYVYKYATGFSCACAIVKKLEEEPDMLKRYRAFLSSGGSDYPVELLRKAGIEVGEAVEICMKEFAEALKEFEALA